MLKQVSFADVIKAFLGIYKPSLIIGLILMFSIDYFKAYRSKILVGSDRIGIGDMFVVSLIRNAFNMVCLQGQVNFHMYMYLKESLSFL